MALDRGFPPLPGVDRGGTTYIDGSYAGATLPSFMDPLGNHGEIVVLKLEPVCGKLPEHPFLLRKSVENWINGKIEGAFPEAGGRSYALKVRSKWQYERLLNMAELEDGTAIKITKHTNLNSARCVINCRDLIKVKDDEILDYLKHQKVSGLRRILRRNGAETETTATVILTIDGARIPEHVEIGYRRFKTRPYYPAPMLCYKCFAFGHPKLRCKQQTTTCGNCAKQHMIVDGIKCMEPQFCSRCNTNEHSMLSRNCPVYKTEDAIQHIRINKGISYPAARRLFEASRSQETFAGVINISKDQTITDLSSQLAEKDKKIENLELMLIQRSEKAKSSEMEELRQMITNLQAEVRRKDDRIEALETALSKSNRLDIVREHGTIEDLVARVSVLENALHNKDKEIATLRLVNQQRKETISPAIPETYRSKSSKQEADNNLPKQQQNQSEKITREAFTQPSTQSSTHISRETERNTMPISNRNRPTIDLMPPTTNTYETRSRSRSGNHKRDPENRKDSRSPPKKEKKKNNSITNNTKNQINTTTQPALKFSQQSILSVETDESMQQ